MLPLDIRENGHVIAYLQTNEIGDGLMPKECN